MADARGCVQRVCDPALRRKAKAADGAALIRANYISNCARVSTRDEPAANGGGIPQLIELAYVAAPGVGASAVGTTGASAIAAGGGIGLTTVLVPVAVVGAIAGGVAAASGGDKAASP